MSADAPVQIPFHCLSMIAEATARELSDYVPTLPLATIQRAARAAVTRLANTGHIQIVVNGRPLTADQQKGQP